MNDDLATDALIYSLGLSLYELTFKCQEYIEGILPKGSYLPCLCMADRALLTGYPDIEISSPFGMTSVGHQRFDEIMDRPRNLKASMYRFHNFVVNTVSADFLVLYIAHLVMTKFRLYIYSIISWHHGLTHWGRAMHICIGKLTIIGSANGLSPGRRQAIIWTIARILLIWPLGTNFSEILIGIQTFSFKEMHLKMSFAKWRPFVSASMC